MISKKPVAYSIVALPPFPLPFNNSVQSNFLPLSVKITLSFSTLIPNVPAFPCSNALIAISYARSFKTSRANEFSLLKRPGREKKA